MTSTIDPSLRRVLEEHGASFAEHLGMELPARFGDVAAEWRAAREGCAVAVTAYRTLLRARGADRIEFLHGMLSNDVKRLENGTGCEAALLTQQGKLVADLRVYAQPEQLLIDLFRSRADALREALERFIVADEVEIDTAELAPLLAVEGPDAAHTIAAALDPVGPLGRLGHVPLRFRDSSLFVVAASEIGGTGLVLCGPPAVCGDLFRALVGHGATPLGMEALNVLRIEGGVAWYGIDMDESCLVLEAGLERAISFSKGCYLGQEVVERVSARGHVNRRLTGLVVEGDRPPAAGAVVASAERELGHVTSAVRSPALGRVIALAYVHRSALAPGTTVEIRDTQGVFPATVVTLPFLVAR